MSYPRLIEFDLNNRKLTPVEREQVTFLGVRRRVIKFERVLNQLGVATRMDNFAHTGFESQYEVIITVI